MPKKSLFSIIIITLLFLLSCNSKQDQQISSALSLSDDYPDSALTILKSIDKKTLNDKDLARYALIFTKSQDKSGIDVDNDSLIGIAYDWYKSRIKDSLYATCQYYMGKYYLLNDNDENALECFQEAIKKSEDDKDTALECLALGNATHALYLSDPHKALDYANKAFELYRKLPKTTEENTIYYKLNISNCYAFLNNPQKAISIAKQNLFYTSGNKDSVVISDIYRDLSNFYRLTESKDSCLYYAKNACRFTTHPDNSLLFSLASAYLSTDSLDQAYILLKNIKPEDLSDKYVIYYDLSKIAMAKENMDSVKSFVDSADSYLSRMYKKTLNTKEQYYSSSLKNAKEKDILKRKTLFHRVLFTLSLLIFIFIVITLTFIYKEKKKRIIAEIQANKDKAKLKIEHEREIFEKEKSMAEKLHQEEIAHREIQLSVMRTYLMKKVEVINKLENNREKTKHLCLSEEDWTELEVFLNGVDDTFVIRFRESFPQMEEKDIKLMMLLRLKLPQKILADIYCISEKAVKQKLYLYKDKVGLKGSKTSLREYIETF